MRNTNASTVVSVDSVAWSVRVVAAIASLGIAVLLAEPPVVVECYRPPTMQLSAATNALIAVESSGQVLNSRERLIFELGYMSAMGIEACFYVNDFRMNAEKFRDSLNDRIDFLVAALGGSGVRVKGCNRPQYFADRIHELMPVSMLQQLKYAEKLFIIYRFHGILSVIGLVRLLIETSRYSEMLGIPPRVSLTDLQSVYLFVFQRPWSTPSELSEVRADCDDHDFERSRSQKWVIISIVCIVAGSALHLFAAVPIFLDRLIGQSFYRLRIHDKKRAKHTFWSVQLLVGACPVGALCVMYSTFVSGRVTDADVVKVLAYSALLTIVTRFALHCRRALGNVNDASTLPAGRFVLFLRSFSSDGPRKEDGSPSLAMQEWSEEQELVELLSNAGPVFACQDPTDPLPQLGAIRIRAPDDWRVYLREAMLRAHVIVVRDGSTNGLNWELSELDNLNLRARTLFVTPEKIVRERSEARHAAIGNKGILHLDANFRDLLDALLSIFFPIVDINNPRFRFCDADGLDVVCFAHLLRFGKWFSRFQRALDTRRGLELFARLHDFSLSYQRWSQDLISDLMCACLAAWLIWWQLVQG